jgi:hypothetical protein
VKQLDDRLSLVVGLFYFIPYVALVVAPVVAGLEERGTYSSTRITSPV